LIIYTMTIRRHESIPESPPGTDMWRVAAYTAITARLVVTEI